jgi:nitrogen fixation NifU-like protein
LSGRDRVDALYREVVLEHYRHPRGREPLSDPERSALVDNPVCGDQVKVEVSLADGRVREVSARARGCAIAVAAASVMTELVPGLDREGCAQLEQRLDALLGGEAPHPSLDPRLAALRAAPLGGVARAVVGRKLNGPDSPPERRSPARHSSRLACG